MSYPLTPGYSNLTTSKEAAEKVDYLNQRERVLQFICSRGSYGATTDEIVEALGLLINSGSARVAELTQFGKIIDSGEIRINLNGNRCIVHVMAPDGTPATIRHQTYKQLLEENALLRRRHSRCMCPFKDSF